MDAIRLSFPPRSEYVAVVRLAIAALAREAGLDEERVEDLKIAVSEACANAVLGAQAGGAHDFVTLEWAQQDGVLALEIGHGGDPSPPGQGDAADRLEFSMALLHTLVDDCRIDRDERGSTSVRLKLHI